MAGHADVDPELVERAVAGDRDAVCALTRAFLPRVFGLALRLCHSRELAEEATQETFVRALKALPKLRAHERLKSWLLTITANTTRELMRKSSQLNPLEYDPPAEEAEVDDKLRARQRALEAAVAALETDERELFLLHTVEGVRLKELAEQHETSVPAMKSRVHRIRSKIRVNALAHLQRAGAAT